MKEVLSLLRRYQSLGVSFQLKGSGVLIESPKSVSLSKENISELKAMKAEIIKALVPCPARCLSSGLCFGTAWFGAKPSKERHLCDIAACRWETQRHEVMTNGRAQVDGEMVPFTEAYVGYL